MTRPKSAAEDVAAWSDSQGRKRKPGRPTVPPSKLATASSEVERMLTTADWTGATKLHLVALYAWCHRKVYGIDNADLADGVNIYRACGAAQALVDVHFHEDITDTVAFIRWTWRREHGREQWRRENKRDGGSIGWRLQFSANLVTEYKLHLARSAQ